MPFQFSPPSTSADVGLGNVNNTSDADKPISTAQQTAIDLKKTDSMATNKLLGRGTAATGVIEEITLGTNLSLTGTTLNAAGGAGGGDVAGPASAGDAKVVLFDGTTGKLIKDSGLTLSGTNTGDQTLGGLGGQPLDSDLTTIAGLTATTDNFMVAASSAWASRTPTQAKTSLALVKGDVGLGSVDNTSDAGKPVSTAQQTALDLKANLAGPTFTGTVVLPAGTVTKAMQENMATASLVYRKTAGSGAPEINTLATVKTDLLLTGTNSGDQTTIVGITGTIAQFNTAITDGDLATGGGTATGTNTGDQTLPTDATIVTTDVTTNNVTTSKHGWFPKLPTATGLFLKDDLTWAAPAGGSGVSLGLAVATVSGLNLM